MDIVTISDSESLDSGSVRVLLRVFVIVSGVSDLALSFVSTSELASSSKRVRACVWSEVSCGLGFKGLRFKV